MEFVPTYHNKPIISERTSLSGWVYTYGSVCRQQAGNLHPEKLGVALQACVCSHWTSESTTRSIPWTFPKWLAWADWRSWLDSRLPIFTLLATSSALVLPTRLRLGPANVLQATRVARGSKRTRVRRRVWRLLALMYTRHIILCNQGKSSRDS